MVSKSKVTRHILKSMSIWFLYVSLSEIFLSYYLSFKFDFTYNYTIVCIIPKAEYLFLHFRAEYSENKNNYLNIIHSKTPKQLRNFSKLFKKRIKKFSSKAVYWFGEWLFPIVFPCFASFSGERNAKYSRFIINDSYTYRERFMEFYSFLS